MSMAEGLSVAESDLQLFTAHVRETMFKGAETHRWPDEWANLWPNITPEFRFQHTLHVRRLVERLQGEEGGDLSVLQTAAIFHDISHFCSAYDVHGHVAAEMTRDYLSGRRDAAGRAFSADFIDKVYLTIDDHASNKPDSYYLGEVPHESMLLIQADLADKLGPCGAVNQLLLSGYNHRFWQATIEALELYVIGRGERALANDGKRHRLTRAGRRLIEERMAWVRDFLIEMRQDMACVF
jgi:hypothetical protein